MDSVMRFALFSSDVVMALYEHRVDAEEGKADNEQVKPVYTNRCANGMEVIVGGDGREFCVKPDTKPPPPWWLTDQGFHYEYAGSGDGVQAGGGSTAITRTCIRGQDTAGAGEDRSNGVG